MPIRGQDLWPLHNKDAGQLPEQVRRLQPEAVRKRARRAAQPELGIEQDAKSEGSQVKGAVMRQPGITHAKDIAESGRGKPRIGFVGQGRVHER